MDAAKRHQRAVALRRGGLGIVEDGKARIARAELTHHLHRSVCDHGVVIAEQRGDCSGVLGEISRVHFWRCGVFVVSPDACQTVQACKRNDGLFARASVFALQRHDERCGRNVRLLIFAIGECAQSESAHRGVARERGNGLIRLRAESLLERVERGDAHRRRSLCILRDGLNASDGILLQPATNERPLRLQARAIAGRLQQLHQLAVRRLRKIRHLRRDVSLRRDAHDVAVLRAAPIKSRRAFPTRHVSVAARVHINVRRARDLHQFGGLFRLLECRALRLHRVAENRAASPVARVGQIIPRSGPAGLINPARAAAGAAAVIRERLDDLIGEIFIKTRVAVILEAAEMVKANIPAAAVVRIVAGENIHQRRDRRFEDVAGAARIELQAGAVGPHADDPAAAKLQFPPVRALRLHETKVAARDVEPAVNAHLHAVRRVVGGAILESERDIFHQHLLLVADAVAVLVNERAEMGRMHAIHRVAVHHETARRIQILHKFLHLVRTSVAIGVAQAQDASAIGFAVERAVAVAAYKERAIRRSRDEDRVVRLRRRGEKRRLKTLRHLHVLEPIGLLWKRLTGKKRERDERDEDDGFHVLEKDGAWRKHKAASEGSLSRDDADETTKSKVKTKRKNRFAAASCNSSESR